MSGKKTQSEEEHDSNVMTDSHDTNEDGEVAPSEDELTNVQYSESEKGPTPGPSTTPVTKAKKVISPIKYPEATPKKKREDLPLSKLETPRRQGTDARQDLRRKLDMVPVFSEPKLDSGNLESRVGRDLVGPWLPGNGPNRDSGNLESRVGRDLMSPWLPGNGPNRDKPHNTRPFIARNITWQDRGTGNSDEEEEDDVGTDGVDDLNNPRRK